MIEIKLTPMELFSACTVGIKRRIESIKANLKRQDGTQANWNDDIEGACAEMAAAKAIDRFWSSSVNTFTSEGDVGPLEIRTTSHSNGCLLLRPRDKDNARYILVTGSNGRYIVHGWILGCEGKKDEYKKAPNGLPPAFFIPSRLLNPLSSLNREGLT